MTVKTPQSTLSYQQLALYLLFQQHPTDASYNIGGAVRVNASLDVKALLRALTTLVKRHSMLRATFDESLAGPYIRIASHVEPQLRIIQAADWSEEELRAGLAEEFHRPFNLSKDALLRVTIYKRTVTEYVLQLTAHHIIADLWSYEVLARELMQILSHEMGHQSLSLPALSQEYADYVSMQQSMLSSSKGERARKYWERQLVDYPSHLTLLTDHPQPIDLSRSGARCNFILDSALTVDLERQARQQNVTPFVFLLAAFKVLLYRYAGQDDIIVGTPVSCRPRQNFRSVAGHFVNPVAIRSRIQGDMQFGAFLHALNETVRDALAHSQYPFSLLVKEAQPTRRYAASPIFQAQFVWESLPSMATRDFAALSSGFSGVQTALSGFILHSLWFERLTAQFELSLSMTKYQGSYLCSLDYSTDLYEASTIERLAAHFQTLLPAVADCSVKICDLPLLTDSDLKQFDEWNGSSVKYSEEHLVHELFVSQALRTPDAPAVTSDGHTLSYEALNRRADQLAAYLRTLQLPYETLIGILLEPGIDIVVSMLGVLKAGAAYIPLNPDEPPDRLNYLLQDAVPSVILTTTDLVARVQLHAAHKLCLDTNWEDGIEPQHDLDRPLPDLAYVIYTSGSTGAPKGVMITHKAICNRLLWMRDEYDVKDSDCVLQKTPYTFDVSVWEIFLPLCCGARIVVGKRAGNKDPSYLAELIRQENITIVHFVPSLLHHFLAEPGLERLGCLRRVFSSGEVLSKDLRDDFQGKVPAELHNLYGPTEAAIDVTAWTCQRGETKKTVPIGRPIANTRIYILDRYMNRVPVGQEGELYIGGTGLARGYWRKPHLTAERFLPNTFASHEAERIYKTGDLARFNGDGVIEFLGRYDTQMKIRGARIEIEEIEAVLRQYPGINEAVVVPVHDDNMASPWLAAYLLADRHNRPLRDDIQRFVRQRLPEQFIPASYQFLETLPLTSSGKVDRRSIARIPPGKPHVARQYVEPQNSTEELLARIWQEVLATDSVGVLDDFFEMGGDSLRILQVRTNARQHGYDLSVPDMFTSPMIRELATKLKRVDLSETSPTNEPFALLNETERQALGVEVQDAYPLSHLQAGLVFHSLIDPNYHVYVLSLHIRAPLDVGSLQHGLSSLASRHEMLRTSYDLRTFDRPLQFVQKTVDIPVEVFDLREEDADRQEALIRELVEAESAEAFDWSKAPFVRIRIDRRTDASFQLTVTHPTFDGWSLAVLMTELFTEYINRIAGRRPPEVLAPRVRYSDFVLTEQAAAQSAASRTFWQNKLSTYGVSLLRSGSVEESGPDNDESRFRVSLPAQTGTGLKELAASERVPLKSVLLAAHLRVVGLLTGRTDVVTGLITHGRLEEPDGDRAVGLFLNTVPVCVNLSHCTWRELVHLAFKAEHEIWPHRQYPLAEIKTILDRIPFDTAFNFVNLHIYKQLIDQKQFEIIGWESPADPTYFPFCAYYTIDPITSDLLFSIDFNPQYISETQVKEAAGYYLSVYERLIGCPDESIHRRPLLSEPELTQQIGDWNQTEADLRPDIAKPFYRLFEEWASKTPDANVAVFGSAHLSYKELNQRSNRLARYLQRIGVGSGTVVAILVRRKPEMLIAALGVMKAGGAYCPLDPSHPPLRLQQVIRESGIGIVLVEEALGESLPPVQSLLVRLSENLPMTESEAEDNLDLEINMDSLAYIIYTSGSTGIPKGVEISHRSLANLLLVMKTRLGVSRKDILLSVTSFSFDIAALELFLPLISGARVVVTGERDIGDAETLNELIETSQASIVQATPSTWRLFIESGWKGSNELQILCGGEMLQRELAHSLLATGAVVWNLYGPTETTIWSAAHQINRADEASSLLKPLANTSMYVLDDTLNPIPLGVTGELYIGGEGLARGYCKDPNTTAVRFVPHPFSDKPGERLYKTSDLARFHDDGSIEILGRLDQQVKIRGLRIELPEIEFHLTRHAEVKEAVVAVKEFGPGDRRLIGFIRPENQCSPTSRDLKTYLSSVVPQHMVPSDFIAVDKFPRTSNGKLDRKAVDELYAPSRGQTECDTSRLTEVQQLVMSAWWIVLEREDINLDDNFFEVGGHSLLLIRVANILQDKLQRTIPLSFLFLYPTINLLAKHLEDPDGSESLLSDTSRRSEKRKRSRAQRESIGRRRRDRISITSELEN